MNFLILSGQFLHLYIMIRETIALTILISIVIDTALTFNILSKLDISSYIVRCCLCLSPRNITYTSLPSVLNIKHAGLHYFCLDKFVIVSDSSFHILA